MTEWTTLEWLAAIAAAVTIITGAVAGYRLLRRHKTTKDVTDARLTDSPESTIVGNSPAAAVITHSPGAIVNQGSLTLTSPGYSLADHQRIVEERVTQTREDLERAHQAEIESLLLKIDSLTRSGFNFSAVKEVYDALTAKDFDRAETLLAGMEASHTASTVLPAHEQQVRLRTLRAEAALLNDDANAAVEHFQEAAEFVESLDPGRGPHLRNHAAQRLAHYAKQFGGDGIVKAIQLYRINLDYWTQADHPEEWAGTQNNLANAFVRLAGREVGEAALRHLTEAIVAFREALKVRTRHTHPADWATTQFNLGAALVRHAQRLGGEQGVRLLNDANRAFRAALHTLNREQHPDRWATAQHNLGAALALQGNWRGGQEGARLCSESIEAVHSALQVRTRENDPNGWTISQFMLASALSTRAYHLGAEQGAPLMLEAAEIYRSLLQVRTRDTDPVGWGSTQRNLATILSQLGEWREDEKGVQYINEAIQALQNALNVFTRESHSDDWMGRTASTCYRLTARCQIRRNGKTVGRSSPKPFSYTGQRSKPSPRRPIPHAGRTSTTVSASHWLISATGPTNLRASACSEKRCWRCVRL